MIGAICNAICVYTALLACLNYEESQRSSSVVIPRGLVDAAMIIAGVISGFGCSLIWVAYGVYIAECANF